MRTYPKLLRTNGKLAQKLRVGAQKFGLGARKFFSQNFLIFFADISGSFHLEQWDQVKVDHNAKALKLRHYFSNTEPAL